MKRILLISLILPIMIIANAQTPLDENKPTENIESGDTCSLTHLRQQIDSLDNQLMNILTERMRVCREVGEYKKCHNINALQSSRFNEILEKRTAQGSQNNLSPTFIVKIFNAIHDESLRQQAEILGE